MWIRKATWVALNDAYAEARGDCLSLRQENRSLSSQLASAETEIARRDSLVKMVEPVVNRAVRSEKKAAKAVKTPIKKSSAEALVGVVQVVLVLRLA